MFFNSPKLKIFIRSFYEFYRYFIIDSQQSIIFDLPLFVN